MKLRTGFVTNSSSSCFGVLLKLELDNNETLQCYEDGLTATVSPRQLGMARDVEELIGLLETGMVLRYGSVERFVFGRDQNDQTAKFLADLREKVTDMNRIVWITVKADQYRYGYECALTYDRTTGAYEGYQIEERSEGYEEEIGELLLEDLSLCKMLYDPWQDINSPAVLTLPILNDEEDNL